MPSFDSVKEVKRLGRGAFGEVFLVEEKTSQLADSQFFALKRIIVDHLSAESLEKVGDEAKLLQRLSEESSHILHCFGSRTQGSPPRYVELLLEYSPLGDLNERIRHHVGATTGDMPGLPQAEVLAYSKDIAAALAIIHDKRPKILHRDVKPANILLFPSTANVLLPPRAKLADFGIARVLESDDALAEAATVIGTPAYLSPEMCMGRPYDEKADMWALGCVMYELVCLKKPFHKVAQNIAALAIRISEGRYDEETLLQQGMPYSQVLTKTIPGLLMVNQDARLSAASTLDSLTSLQSQLNPELEPATKAWLLSCGVTPTADRLTDLAEETLLARPLDVTDSWKASDTSKDALSRAGQLVQHDAGHVNAGNVQQALQEKTLLRVELGSLGSTTPRTNSQAAHDNNILQSQFLKASASPASTPRAASIEEKEEEDITTVHLPGEAGTSNSQLKPNKLAWGEIVVGDALLSGSAAGRMFRLVWGHHWPEGTQPPEPSVVISCTPFELPKCTKCARREKHSKCIAPFNMKCMKSNWSECLADETCRVIVHRRTCKPRRRSRSCIVQ